MTPNELDTLVKDLNVRVDRVEQILPTLATKQDLAALEERLRTHMRVLHEDVRSDVRLMAEHLAGAIERWDRRS